MTNEQKRLNDVKHAIETAFEIKDISSSCRVEEFCLARHFYVFISFKRYSLNIDLIMSTIKRKRPAFYNSRRKAKEAIKFNKYHRELYTSILKELNIKL